MIRKTSIVLGSLFGDEGKGSTVNYLVEESKKEGYDPIVVRFSGGPQAGHHVKRGETSHVFSHFGAGSLAGAPTFWSKYCYTEPGACVKEYEALLDLNEKDWTVFPRLYVDLMSPVITPWDRHYNRADSSNLNHGSCGMGVGAAAMRMEETPYQLYVKDLLSPEWILRQRVEAIKEEYSFIKTVTVEEEDLFFYYVKRFQEFAYPLSESRLGGGFRDHLIFEGSQGILLDRDHGFFPNVTRASTTSKNAKEIIDRHGLPLPEVYYVTRPYITRHGNGPIGPVESDLELINTEGEINVTNEFQGVLRKAPFNMELFNYALTCDPYYQEPVNRTIVITCMDQIKESVKMIDKHREKFINKEYFPSFMPPLYDVITSSNYQFKKGR